MTWLGAILRRFLLPAFVGAYLANIAVYQMLDSEGALTDWQSIGVLFAIILAGIVAAWPLFLFLRHRGVRGALLAVLLLVIGTALGVLAAYLIALRLVPDTAGDYAFFGLGVGPVAALLWLILNLDVLRARRAAKFETDVADTYDLIVLGSGPGGYVAAIRAAQLGLKTAIVEREQLGGICLNWGCIPTKALLRSAEIYHYMQHAGSYGLKAAEISADIDAVVKRSRGVAKQLNQGVTHLMKKNKIAVHMGDGVLKSANTIAVTKDGKSEDISAKNIIIATGARARDLPFAPADGQRIWTYRHAMVPPAMPTKLLVIGSGAIGIEFASFYNDMGAEVTVVEMLDRIVPVEDEDVSAFLEKALKKQGMTIMTGAGVQSLKATANGVSAEIKDKDGKVAAAEFSHCIVAIGIVPNTENIGLEALGVATDRGFLKTDAMCRTNVPGVWAIGDITAPPWLAHKASHEGVIAAEAIAGGHPHAMDPKNIPGCTYCHPQIASVGLTEAKAKAAGYEVKVGNFPFIGNGKAIALGEVEGFVKTIFDAKTGELLGAHMVGAEVTEMIQGYTVGKTAELVEADFMHSVYPHPTISETMHESVLGAYGRMLHM